MDLKQQIRLLAERSRDAARALEILRARPDGAGACVIGKASGESPARVLLKSAIGVQRILDMASGEQLPRIC